MRASGREGGEGRQKQMDRHTNTHVYRLKGEREGEGGEVPGGYTCRLGLGVGSTKRQRVLHELQLQKFVLNIYKHHP